MSLVLCFISYRSSGHRFTKANTTLEAHISALALLSNSTVSDVRAVVAAWAVKAAPCARPFEQGDVAWERLVSHGVAKGQVSNKYSVKVRNASSLHLAHFLHLACLLYKKETHNWCGFGGAGRLTCLLLACLLPVA